MYGVVEIGGHQYKVEAGDLFDVEKLSAEVGSEVVLDKVLFVGGDKPQVGTPVVSGATVKAKVVRQAKDRKVRVFRKPDKKWKKTIGHRQNYTGLLITEVVDGEGNKAVIDPKSKNAEKYLK